jgi:hypothetical protein
LVSAGLLSAGLLSAGFDSAGLAGAAGVDDPPQAARIEVPAAPASTPRKPRREKIRSDAIGFTLLQWSVREDYLTHHAIPKPWGKRG